ncbi:nucleotide exchange factor GrpE [Salinibacterium sp. dk2585]|uniref:nucleotide exchange factor GrpE n=1 Tax=unclassified Salinibacterium TaxID=2632331 RepID=UPI0011C244DF|nr:MULTISPECIES: nucleotide exchange factor GrpE [unclassified Salinibacterium]QEE60282.1 nucleotide exchange factor GrpE [Salinibacterium sp. dk2585]TXK55354.1 nucleotide exchange factor GrpE [Salinibacterium sp. dk5596]
MADQNHNKDQGADVPEPDVGREDLEEAADGLLEAEGPDVETSLDDADLSFLEQNANDLAAERLADLQRLQAEYANYRKRVDRDREVNRLQAAQDLVASLLPVLDDLDLAESHGDLQEGGPFALIAQKLRTTLEKTGLERLGAKDDEFDPNLHEAIAQIPNPDVTVMTVLDVHKVGYRMGDRLLRAAQVAVAVPQE